MKTISKFALARSTAVIAPCGPLKDEIKGTSLATGADAVTTTEREAALESPGPDAVLFQKIN